MYELNTRILLHSPQCGSPWTFEQQPKKAARERAPLLTASFLPLLFTLCRRGKDTLAFSSGSTNPDLQDSTRVLRPSASTERPLLTPLNLALHTGTCRSPGRLRPFKYGPQSLYPVPVPLMVMVMGDLTGRFLVVKLYTSYSLFVANHLYSFHENETTKVTAQSPILTKQNEKEI